MEKTFEIPDGRSSVWSLDVNARARFIARTYLHLAGALIAFVLIECTIFDMELAEPITNALLGLPGGWLAVLGGFVLASWIASRTAHTARSLNVQYIGLGIYVLAEAIIFVPMLYFASSRFDGVIQSAVAVSLIGFIGLTGVAFMTRRDFSFLRGILMWGGMSAMIAIVAGLIFGFTLGPMFSVAMIAFAGCAILYDTSNVLHHFPEDRYVGASLELFASVTLLFWYVLRTLMAFASDD